MMASFSAFILGATGEVGKELVKELARCSQFHQVVPIGRRNIVLPEEVKEFESKFKDEFVDFKDLRNPKFDGIFKHDVGFCALATTRGKAGSQFFEIEHDYVVNSAKIAKESGCTQFHVITGTGANKDSRFLSVRTKGLVEEDLKEIGFDRLVIYRPGLLLCDRVEYRLTDKIMQGLLSPLDRGRKVSIETSSVAKAMVSNALKSYTGTGIVEGVSHRQIREMAKNPALACGSE